VLLWYNKISEMLLLVFLKVKEIYLTDIQVYTRALSFNKKYQKN
jgi:hypothetical protein